MPRLLANCRNAARAASRLSSFRASALFINEEPDRPRDGTLSANMGETVTPWKFSVEGESGLESDERTGAGPWGVGDRGGGKGDAAAVHGGIQAEDRAGGRRVQDAGHRRGVAAAGGVVLLPS